MPDDLFRYFTTFGALFFLLLSGALVFKLVSWSWLSFQNFGIEFLLQDEWDPAKSVFGALGSLYGSCLTIILALCFALPLSLALSLFLFDLSLSPLRSFLIRLLQIFSAIPGVIYGLWGLFYLVPFFSDIVQPFLQNHFGELIFFQGPTIGVGYLTAAMLLALMMIPFLSVLFIDIYRVVPSSLREVACGLGATQWEAFSQVILPYSFSAMMGAVFIAMGRALGETMIVAFVIGNKTQLTFSLFEPASTMTSLLANEFASATNPLHQSALVEMALLLLILALIVQMIAQYWMKRLRKEQG